MTVLICNDVPPAIRGMLKRWFIEPRPNVFVGTLNVRNHRKVMDFVIRNAPKEFGILCISSAINCQGYMVERFGPEGDIGRKNVDFSGISLLAEKSNTSENCPF